MHRFRALIVASLVIVNVTVGGCASAERQDLERYVTQQIPMAERMEHVTLQAMRDAHHTKATNPQKLSLFKQKLLPLATRYVQLLQAIEPTTPAVAALHAIKLEAARLQQQAIGDFVAALERDDDALARSAGEKFGAYQAKLNEYQAKRDALAKKVGYSKT